MVVANMEEQIRMLLELQQLDTEIFDKKRILEEVPERIKEIGENLANKSADLKNLEEELKKTQAKRKEKDLELETKEQSIKKYQTQLFQVKTNKEYTVLEKEIAGIKADNSLLEEEIIIILDQIDEVKRKVEKENAILAEEKKKSEREKQALLEEKNKNESEFNDLNNKRKEFIQKIDKTILAPYERILHNRDGLAMVPIIEGACGGCNMNLPPQGINEAKLKKRLTTCGNCARILFSE